MNTESQEGDASEQVIMADLSGMMLLDVEAALEEAGLLLNLVEEFSDVPEGMVLGQEPAPDTEVNKGSYVTVRISKGPERIYMKNVGLMTFEEAVAEIESLNLNIGNVTEQYSDSVAEGKVISQSIAQDTEVKAGDTVDLVISKGKDPAKQQTQAPKQTRSAEEEAAAAERRAAEAAEAEARRQAEAAAAAEAQRQAEAAAAAAAAQQQKQEDPNRNSAFDMLN